MAFSVVIVIIKLSNMKKTKTPILTPLPPLNAESQKYQEWLDTVQRDGLRLSGRQVTILLNLFGFVEDALTRASNILEQGELTPSAKESAPQHDTQPSVEESPSSQ